MDYSTEDSLLTYLLDDEAHQKLYQAHLKELEKWKTNKRREIPEEDRRVVKGKVWELLKDRDWEVHP